MRLTRSLVADDMHASPRPQPRSEGLLKPLHIYIKDCQPTICELLAINQEFPGRNGNLDDRSADGSSMIVSCASSDILSLRADANSMITTRTSSTIPSLTSAPTLSSHASKTDAGPDNPRRRDSVIERVEESQPEPYTYQCKFHFLGCTKTFEDKDEWLTHCQSHFRGHPPLESILCPFCKAAEVPGAWKDTMEHVATHQKEQGKRFGEDDKIRDKELFFYLYSKRVVSAEEYKSLQKHGKVCQTEGSTSHTYSPGHDVVEIHREDPIRVPSVCAGTAGTIRAEKLWSTNGPVEADPFSLRSQRRLISERTRTSGTTRSWVCLGLRCLLPTSFVAKLGRFGSFGSSFSLCIRELCVSARRHCF